MSYRISHRIGWVTSIESDRLSIELDPGATGLVKGGLAGVLPVGSINSYVTVPAGPTRLVGIITGVRVVEVPPGGIEPYAAEEHLVRRLEAVLIGRLDRRGFQSGVLTYPPLYSPVMPASPAEIEAIFAPGDWETITLGESVVAPGIDIRLWADRLLARHAAILGSTGSGKSCTVTAIIDALLEKGIEYSNIVVLDPNGEYATAFGRETERGQRTNAAVLGPELSSEGALLVPHWFMNNEDHLELLRASEGVQAPLLQRAIADARLIAAERGPALHALLYVRSGCQELRRLLIDPSVPRPQEKAFDYLSRMRDAAARMADEDQQEPRWATIAQQCGRLDEAWNQRPSVWDLLTEDHRALCEDLLGSIEPLVRELLTDVGAGDESVSTDFDAPAYYSMQYLNDIALQYRLDFESINDPRIRQYAAGLMIRLARLLADARYNFMTRVPQFADPLSRFLRLLLGIDLGPSVTDGGDSAPWAESYASRKPHPGVPYSQVTVLDLSLVATDVIENVTALIGRILLDFFVRLEPRASLPTVLVLEEAHRYVSLNESRSRSVFERIAKEGRKFGLGLIVASQRPSELSPTLLAQCGTLVAHRTVNPIDQELVRGATPAASRDVLRQLPGLATQHAVVMGESVPVPAHVRIRDVHERPRSADPAFIQLWRTPPDEDVVERVARPWESPGLEDEAEAGTGQDPQIDSP